MNQNKPIRILQIIDNISVDAGVSSMIINIYRKIDKKKIQFDFLVCNKYENRGKNYEDEIIQLGGKVFYFGSPLSLKSLFRSIQNIKVFFKREAKSYTAVHLHTPTIAEFTLKYAKKYGIKTRIVHSHSTMLSTKWIKTIINSLLVKRIKKYATHYWACSTEAAKFLYGNEFVSNNKIELIWNCVDTELFLFNESIRDNMRKEYGFEDKYVVSHISNFTVIKNHAFLVNVIKEVVNKNNNVIFCFIGDGNTLLSFENSLKKEQLFSHCLFAGRTTAIPSYLSCSDLVILPSLKEGLPVTIVEAQANGLKCILSSSITKECNVSNCVYLPLDTEKWALEIVNNSLHIDNERKKRSVNFKNTKFNIESQIAEIENKYYKACNYV